MPIYEYHCKDCDRTFEVRKSFSESDSQSKCTYCQSINTERALSLCNAHSNGRSFSSGKSGCSGCSGGSCASCH